MIGFVYSESIIMTIKVYSPQILNLGDFLNTFPCLSGLAKSGGDTIRLVVPDSFRQFKGFRDFMEYQPCIDELVFRSEIINMDESSYIMSTYSSEEYRDLTERPNRPIETLRCEKFLRDTYPKMVWDVDDDFVLKVLECPVITADCPRKWLVCDRWSLVSDTRRAWNILKDSGLFDDETRFEFLDYNQPLLDNAFKMAYPSFYIGVISTFTGAGMMADLLKRDNNLCLWDDSMVGWNNAPIEYSYWKHYYGDRPNKLYHLNDPYLKTL